MARRHGSGAVKRRSDGRWEGQLRLADGSRKYVYARSRRELSHVRQLDAVDDPVEFVRVGPQEFVQCRPRSPSRRGRTRTYSRSSRRRGCQSARMPG